MLLSTTLVAFWLGLEIKDTFSPDAGRWSDYWSSFADALTPTAEVSASLGRTMELAAAGIFLGLLLGGAFGLLMRAPKLGRLVGHLTVPAMAFAIPGLAIYPIARAATRQGIAPSSPVELSSSIGDGLAFLGLWGLVVGSAIAPSIAAVIAGAKTIPMLGPQTAANWSAARADTRIGSGFGIPTTAFLLTLAVAEVLSGQQGSFPQFYDALSRRATDETFQFVFWLALAGAVLVIAIEVAGHFLDSETATAERTRPTTTTATGLLMSMTVALALLVAVALAGSFAGATGRDASALLAPPTFGGPWLGTDSVGRGLVHLSAVGLWPAVIAGAVPAAVATVLGTVIAALTTRTPSIVARVFDIATDALWWPTTIMLPLAFVAFGRSGRSDLGWGFLFFTGLALTPLAARLVAKVALADDDRPLPMLAGVLLFCGAVAVSIHIVLGFTGFGGADERPQLGTAIRAGFETYDSSIWPYVVPTAAATLLVVVLYSLSTALTASLASSGADPLPDSDRSIPDPATVPIATTPVPSVSDLGSIAEPVANQTLLVNELPTIRPDESLTSEQQTLLEIQQPASEQAETTALETSTLETPALETQLIDLTDSDESLADTTESLAGTDEASVDPPILEQATRTVELRPSTVRQARMAAASGGDGGSKPALAMRPMPAVQPPGRDSEKKQEVDPEDKIDPENNIDPEHQDKDKDRDRDDS